MDDADDLLADLTSISDSFLGASTPKVGATGSPSADSSLLRGLGLETPREHDATDGAVKLEPVMKIETPRTVLGSPMRRPIAMPRSPRSPRSPRAPGSPSARSPPSSPAKKRGSNPSILFATISNEDQQAPNAPQQPPTGVAPKHKRARSNPDVFSNFSPQEISELTGASAAATASATQVPSASTSEQSRMPVSPSLRTTIRPSLDGPDDLTNDVFNAILNNFKTPQNAASDTANPNEMPGLLNISIGDTPTNIRAPTSLPAPIVTSIAPQHSHQMPPMSAPGAMPSPPPMMASPPSLPGGAPGAKPTRQGNVGIDDSFLGIDDFLKDVSWAELLDSNEMNIGANAHHADHSHGHANPNANGGTMMGNSMMMAAQNLPAPVAFRTQRIQEEVNELKMKHKRPSHARRHSNPVDLLHNLDQFRQLSSQIKDDPTHQAAAMASNAGMMTNGGGAHVGAMAGPHSRHVRSTGLSMDMSHMNLGFLSEQSPNAGGMGAQTSPNTMNNGLGMNDQQSPLGDIAAPTVIGVQQSSNSSTSASTGTGTSSANPNRKMYKCGRCGQPKVGHVCTMPDQRNNWTQVDLEVTKGFKVLRVNCQLLSVKNRWQPMHEDHLEEDLNSLML